MATHAVVAPRTAVVVGAGIVGLSTAWHLQEHGIEVTVLERGRVASGASWGNAGWLSPGLAIPLNEPSAIRAGAESLFNPYAPLSIPLLPGPSLVRFLALFAANSSYHSWQRALRGNAPLSRACLDAYDELVDGGVAAVVEEEPITALFSSEKRALHLLMELRAANEAGVPVEHTPLDGDDVRDLIPVASENIRAGVRLHKQRYINPGVFTHALADAVRSRGGRVVEGFHVSSILPSRRGRGQFTLLSSQGEAEHADTVVAAAGAWMQRAARRWGVHVPVAAGRGYSFTAHTDRPVTGPVYLPEARVACTPLKDGLRVAGTMEFTSPDAPLQRARVSAIARSAAPYFEGVDLNNRSDEWVGPRPVSADGLPLVGPTRVPGLHVAGGHGMWGITHGPITGRLLTRAIATGVIPAELRPFTPSR